MPRWHLSFLGLLSVRIRLHPLQFTAVALRIELRETEVSVGFRRHLLNESMTTSGILVLSNTYISHSSLPLLSSSGQSLPL
jgi:hypothetical protein